MIFLEKIKLIAEVITSTAAALILILYLIKLCKPIKIFFKTTFPLFFRGYTNPDGKKTRFFKGLRLQREQNISIINAIAPDFEMEDVLVLDKNALLDIISKSGAFYTIHQRKK